MRLHKKGFSLIEVLVAVMIVSIAGIALLESVTQGRKAYESAVKKQNIFESAALAVLSSDDFDGVKNSSLADILSSRYKIDNAQIMNQLRSKKISVEKQHNHAWDGNFENNGTQQINSMIQNSIKKISITVDGSQVVLYELSIEGW